MRKPDGDRCGVCGSKRVVKTPPIDEFDDGPIWFCLHCRNAWKVRELKTQRELGVGDYYDNASVMVLAMDNLKAGLGVEAACMLNTLCGHIRESPDPKSEKWLLPQIDELIKAAARVNACDGEPASKKSRAKKDADEGEAKRHNGPSASLEAARAA